MFGMDTISKCCGGETSSAKPNCTTCLPFIIPAVITERASIHNTHRPSPSAIHLSRDRLVLRGPSLSLTSSLAASIRTLDKMALNGFFHNKIESMKLDIIERNSKLRRLEAQRNDYNSRGEQAGEQASRLVG